MNFIERHAGCVPDIVNKTTCFGPDGPYYTLFGHELFPQIPLAFLAIVIGGIFALVLFRLKWRSRISLHWPMIVLLSIFLALIIFLLLVYFFPLVAYY